MLPRDRDQSPLDEAAALDAGFTDVTENTLAGERLRAAMVANDPRVSCVREIYYWCPTRPATGPGSTVGYDHPSQSPSSTEQDHSNHVHISFYRDSVDSLDAVRGVADVMNGHSPQEDEDDLPYTEKELRDIIGEKMGDVLSWPQTRNVIADAVRAVIPDITEAVWAEVLHRAADVEGGTPEVGPGKAGSFLTAVLAETRKTAPTP